MTCVLGLILISTASADTLIEDFEPYQESWRVTSYSGDEDLQPSYWRFDNNQGAEGSDSSFYIYGNTWKLYNIQDKAAYIDSNSVWEVFVRVPTVGTIQAFGVSDGTNELIYILEAGVTPPSSNQWLTYNAGWKNTQYSFQSFRLPVGEDWNDRYGFETQVHVSSLIFINDEDMSNGTVYFDRISDITLSEPHTPVVDAGNDQYVSVMQTVHFQCNVTDPDSSVFDYLWDFGDGVTSTAAAPDHAFDRSGRFNVLCRVTDSTGRTGMDSIHVEAGAGFDTPVISLLFGGDVMFGRRYENPYEGTPLIQPGDNGAGARQIGSHTRRFSADCRIVNLECPLTDEGSPHPAPTKITFRGRPDAVAGLTENNVGIVSLGNNHLFDYLESGLYETLEVLDNPAAYSPYARNKPIAHTGGGRDRIDATLPVTFSVDGLRIGFVGLCSIVGHPSNEQPFFHAGYDKPGVLYLNRYNLKRAVTLSESVTDLTIAMFHGGIEYMATPSEYIQSMAQYAVDYGADFVICHHPHVTEGVEIIDGVPVMYSLGNFMFDQHYGSTTLSCMLDTRFDVNGVQQISYIPAYVENYEPKFVKDGFGLKMIQRFLGLSELLDTPVISDLNLQRAYMVLPSSNLTELTSTTNFDIPLTWSADFGGYTSIPVELPPEEHLAAVNSWVYIPANSTLMLGRDKLMFGNFEDDDLDLDVREGPGWDVPGSTSAQITDSYAYEGENSLRLRRHRTYSTEVVVESTWHHTLEYGKKYMISGWCRTPYSGDVNISVLCENSVYYPYFDDEFTVCNLTPEQDDWFYFQDFFEVPMDYLNYVKLKFYLYPPDVGNESGYGYAYFDDVRLIEWDEFYYPTLPMTFDNPGDYRYITVHASTPQYSGRINLSRHLYEAEDTDNDGVADYIEDVNGDGIVQRGETDPNDMDTDDDGLDDREELIFGMDDAITSPFKPDTDGDGYHDYYEYLSYTDPNDDLSHPSGPTPTPFVCINNGDVTLDGDVTSGDAQLAFMIMLGVFTPTPAEACAADCNADDEITAGDAQLIFATALGAGNCVE